MKKRLLLIGLLILLAIALVVTLLLLPNSFERKKADRETVPAMIASEALTVQPNGLVSLPDEMKHLSDSGECSVVEFGDGTAIYFYTFRGILESSEGYLFVTDTISYADYIDTEHYVSSRNFVNIVELAPNWYSCSTD